MSLGDCGRRKNLDGGGGADPRSASIQANAFSVLCS